MTKEGIVKVEFQSSLAGGTLSLLFYFESLKGSLWQFKERRAVAARQLHAWRSGCTSSDRSQMSSEIRLPTWCVLRADIERLWATD